MPERADDLDPDRDGEPCPECGVPFGTAPDPLAPTCRYCGPPRAEECGFCEGGVIVGHPSNGESGWCPYCDGTGFVQEVGFIGGAPRTVKTVTSERAEAVEPVYVPTGPLLPRVERRYRMAFERTPNRIAQRRWARQRSSPVYLVVERRERRYSRCIDRAMRRAMGDEGYEMFLVALDPANDPPPFDLDPVAQHLGFVEGFPPCTDGPRCAAHGLLTHGE